MSDNTLSFAPYQTGVDPMLLQKDATMLRSHSIAPAGTAEQLVQRARELTPVLRSRATETETLRQVTPASREDIMNTGIHRLFQPTRFGGAEAGLRAAVDVLTALGAGCGSTAWVVAQNIAHNFMVAQWSEKAQREVWGETPAAMLSGILIPGLGKARRAPGGYVLSGRWPYLSGVNVCDWALFTAFVPDEAGVPRDRHFILPRHQFEIIDTWHAMGLRGSSSNDVTVDEVFVPEHMTVTVEDLKGGLVSPGSRADRSVILQAPCYAMFGVVIGSAALGIAESMVATYIDVTRSRVAAMSGGAVASYPTQHVKVAQAESCVKAARLLMYDICDRATAILEAGHLPTDEDRTGFRADAAFAGKLANEAVNLIWDAGGGAGIYDRNPLSRMFRDASAANRHITQNWDANAAAHGRVRLGLPIDNPSL